MPIFDANAYFAAKAAQGNLTDKFSALEAASAAKTQALEEHRLVSQQRAQQKAVEQAAVDASWSGQLGLESGGFLGNRVNEAASLVSGTSRLAGHITSLAPNALSYMDTAPTTAADTEAWNRTKAGKALPEDLALLDRPIGPNSTVRKSFEDAEAHRATGRKVNDFFNLEKIVDPTHRNALTTDLKKGFEEPWAQLSTGVSAIGDGNVLSGSANAVSGLAKLLFNTGDAVISNPTGVKEFVIENAPQLFVGALGVAGKAGMVASNVGYAADTYQQGIENYAKENGGALPPEAERQSMALKAASLALAEQAGDMIGLGAAKLGKKAFEGSADALKSSFKESLKSIGKAGGRGLVGEAPTEGYQTYMEGEITGKPASAADIYTGAVIGGVSGATLAGGGRAVAEVLGATPEKAEERQQEATQKQALQAAVSSGDISAYVDPTKGTYAPEKVVAALYGNSQLPDATPETKQANYEKAVNAVEELQDRRASIALIIEEETALEAEGKKSSKKLYEAQLSKADRQLTAAQESLNAFKLQMQPAVEEDEASITAMKQGDVEATDRMINLSMAIPERLDAKVASELAESKGTKLSETQRTYLRTFAEARVAENTLKGMGGVSEEIYTGSDKNVGIAQYRSRMADAVLAGNQKMADRQLKGLTSFVLDHQTKAQVAQEALDEFRETGKAVQVLSDGKGGWDINRGKPLSRKEVLANGGMTIHQGTPEALVTNIALEATALSKAAAELDAAYAMKFAKATPVATTKPVETMVESAATEVTQPTIGSAPTKVVLTGKTTYLPKDQAKSDKATKFIGRGSEKSSTAQYASAWGTQANTGIYTSDDVVFVSAEGNRQGRVPADLVELGKATAAGAKIITDVEGDRLRPYNVGEREVAVFLNSNGYTEKDPGVWTKKNVASSVATAATQVAPATSSNTEKTGSTKVEQQSKNSTAPEAQEATTEEATVVEEPTTVVPVESGVLTALAQKSPEGSSYKAKNLIADYFTQTEGTEGSSTKRPLVATKNFLSQLSKSTSTALNYLSLSELTDNQFAVVREFTTKATEWSKTIQANLVKRDKPEFYYNDPIQFLIQDQDGKPELDENIKTAMSYAAFSYIAEVSARSPYNTDEEINAILDRDEDHPVTETERAALINVGTRQNVVVNSLGQRAVQALGLKVSPNAPRDTQPRLESALGAHIMKMMMDTGLLDRKLVSGKEMARLTQSKDTDTFAEFQFLKLSDSQEAQSIYQASKGTQGVLDKLFSVESGLKEPSLEPIPFTQKKTRNTNQAVPEVLAKIVAEKNAEANYVRQDMWQLITQLDDQVVLGMAGAESVSAEQTHKIKRASIQAKNDGLQRELERFKDYVGGFLQNQDAGLETPIYFEHSVWKQQRVGIATNVVNPQTSKIHRHMLFRKTWETKVNRNDAAQMDNFRLRVAEGLGIKTDKQSNEKSLAAYEKKIRAPEIKSAVAILRKAIFQGGITAQEQQSLLAGVKAGGENFHSLDALVALAHYAEAAANQQDTFTVQMVGEVDGVTNGPMLSHLLMGAAPTVEELFGLLNRGGFYEEGNEHNQYNLWRDAAGHLDLYETTALHMTQNVQELVAQGVFNSKGKRIMSPQEVGTTLSAIYAFTGTLAEKDGSVAKAGRNIIKTPLTAMVFGSSVGSAIESMANKFVESVYAGIEDVAAGKADLVTTINNINTLLPQHKIPNLPIDKLMDMEFSVAQTDALKKSFKNTLGKAVAQTMQGDFSSFIEQRKQFNTAAQMTFNLYDAVFKGLRDTYVEELIASGELAYRMVYPKDAQGKAIKTLPQIKEPIHDLTTQQYGVLQQRLKAMAPVMHTAMSKDGGSLNAGLYMSKSGRKLSTQNTYEGEIKFGSKFKDNKAVSTKVRGYESAQTAPGVAMAPMSVHSTDSAISHYAAAGNEVLNIHDAHGAGLATFEQTAQNLNQATWKAMLNYSPASEAYAALSRVMTGLASLVQEGNLPAGVVKNLSEVVASYAAKEEITSEEALMSLMGSTKAMSYQADDMKLQALGLMTSIDQYALQGGNYNVTEQDRKEAATKRAELTMGLTAQEQESIAVIDKLLSGTSEAVQVEADPEMDVSVAQADVLGIPNIQAMQLLEHASQDKSLSNVINAQMGEVLNAMATSAQSLKEAVLATLNKADVPGVVQLLSKRFNALKRNEWDEVGTPRIQSDPELVAYFEANPEVTADKAIRFLYGKINQGSDSRTKDFSLKLLKVLAKTTNPKLRLRYVTPATAPDQVLAKPATKARGWYVSKNRWSEEVYLLSPDFVHSGLTAETMIHEITHSALGQVVENEYQERKFDPQYKSEVLDLIDELETLRVEAKRFMESNNQKKFMLAVTDVHELIAWGMTNQEFQRTVLNQISINSKTRNNSLVKGMKVFIENLVGILFKGSKKSEKAQANSGMSVLIANVSGLFNQVAQTKERTNTGLNLAQGVTEAINTYSTLDIYGALATEDTDSTFDNHLRDLLGGIVEKLHGPYGSFKETLMKNTASNPLDVWLKALDTGVAPFASQALASGFTITPQEAFVMEQVEVTMQAALDNGALTKVAYRELSDLYTEVRAKLKVQDFHDGDWATASTDEQAKAKALHDFVFKIEKTNGDKSDYLARFAALGLAHQGFNKLLQIATDRDTRRLADGKGFAERIQILFEKVLAFFNGMVTGTYAGQMADSKLTMLVNNLVGIEAKKRHSLKRQATSFNYMAPIEKGAKALTEGARAKMGDLAGSALVRNSASGLVRGAGALARTVAGDKVEIYLEGLARLRNKEFKGRQGVVAGLLNDVRGPKEVFNALLRESKNHERIRKNTITRTPKVVLQAFANDGKDLSKKAKEAVSAVFLRTGAHVLTIPELTQVLGSPKELQKAIADTEKQLDTFAKFKPYFIKQANVLAYYKATGKVKGDMLLMNAHSIARMYGTPYSARITEQQASQAEAVVDKLATLYALEYLGGSHLAQAANVLRTENQRTDGNGVEFVLKLHKRLEEESNARLFAGRKTLMMKGYAPEIYNPHTEIQVANEEEGKELVKLGYVRGALLERDSADPDSETQHFYVLKDGGLQPHLTGIIAYNGKKAKGTKKHNGYMNVNTDAGLANASLQASITGAKQKAVQQLFKNEPRKDLSKVQGAYMAPVLNDKGEVVSWRYLMAESTKDTLLERDNRFEKILGVLAGSIYSKETTQEQNQKVVSALKEDYDQHHTDNNDAYVLVGPKSTDKEFREIWNLLPDDTKAEVRKVWGFDGMYVRSDSLDITFGYRKLSLSQIFDKDPEARNQLEKLFAAVIQWNLTLYARTRLGMNQQDAEDYAQRAGVVVARGERIWQELVRETKDIIVVKTGLVMLGNITSNLTLLMVAGVSMKDILQSHLVAMKGATSYQNDSVELNRYKTLLDTGYTQGNEAEIRRNILRLEDAIARNPVKGLIDAGLMPTIVEDVAADDDLYSYKSAFARKTERFTSKLNDKVVSAGKLVYMTHDTKAYQLLSRTTQLSDFVARYTLYQHLTTRKENPLSHGAAIQEASDAFVNYDIPMHRGMQYTDDMGITMFTKYFVRIQRVLLKLGRENPARMLMLALLNNYMDLMPNVVESSALAHLGNNPLKMGAFQFPGSLDELGTVNSAMSLLK